MIVNDIVPSLFILLVFYLLSATLFRIKRGIKCVKILGNLALTKDFKLSSLFVFRLINSSIRK